MIQEFQAIVSAGQSLSMEQMSSAIDSIMQGQCSDDQVGQFLLGLRRKGETLDEVAGAAAAMRKHMSRIESSHDVFVDTCGTGGDGTGTFNISTAAALVTAAAGLPVAKHGNRSISSKSGSADVLKCLGVNIEASIGQVEQCLNEVGICFCFAPLFHQSMKHVAAVRKKLAVPTVFNLLGPLCNPAGAPFQLIGVGKANLRSLLAAALAKLGCRRAFVVHGADGLDEVTLGGKTLVSEVTGKSVSEIHWSPAEFGRTQAGLESLVVAGPEESAQVIREVLAGQKGPSRDIVLLNAAAALLVAEKHPSPDECANAAALAIDTGQAQRLLDQLVQVSNRN